MKKQELSELYARTLAAYGRKEPVRGEFDAWENVLGQYSFADLDAAIRRWQSTTEVEDFTQKPKGSRMPTPAELSLAIKTFNQANSAEFEPCGKCESGWVRVFEGKTYRGNQIDPKIGALKRCQCFMDWAAMRRKSA